MEIFELEIEFDVIVLEGGVFVEGVFFFSEILHKFFERMCYLKSVAETMGLVHGCLVFSIDKLEFFALGLSIICLGLLKIVLIFYFFYT